MTVSMPKSLAFRGRVINHAGRGRQPGAHVYFDPVRGQVYDLFFVQVEQTGPVFCRGAVAGNAALGAVRIDAAALPGGAAGRVGEVFLAGPLEYTPAGPRAAAAWPISPADAGPPVGRRTGTITHVAATGTYGRITVDGSPVPVFAHASQLRGVRLAVGQRCRFFVTTTVRGPAAADIGPA